MGVILKEEQREKPYHKFRISPHVELIESFINFIQFKQLCFNLINFSINQMNGGCIGKSDATKTTWIRLYIFGFGFEIYITKQSAVRSLVSS